MKANLPRSAAGRGPFHGYDIRLTIGMIVKNEEKTLDRCLRSLQPLLKAVPSELIITDTGSTDATVEIARKYTDHILFFQWCDDFSAARNTGLKAARGEWFLFLDGDEWFENTDGLIEFFSSGECDKYGSATYIQRNYADYLGENYNDYHTLRLSRMYPGIRFQHIVHEDFGRPRPIKFLKDFVHHYGYVFQSAAEKQAKLERNRKLLEQELEQNPEDVKAYAQLAMQYLAADAKRVEEYALLGLEAERKHPDQPLRILLDLARAKAFFQLHNWPKLLDLLDELAAELPEEEIYWLDLHYLGQAAAFFMDNNERSEVHGRAYLEVWEKYRADQLNQDALAYTSYWFIEPKSREQVVRVLAQTALNQNCTEQAEMEMDRLELTKATEVKPYLRLAIQVCRKTGDWTKYAVFYRKACPENSGGRWLEMLHGLEEDLPAGGEERGRAACEVAQVPEDGDPYVRLCRLRKAESEEKGEAARGELGWFAGWRGDWNPVLADVLLFAMKEKVNLLPMLLRIDAEDLKYYVAEMQRSHADFPRIARDSCEAYSYENLRGIFWTVCLQEKVLLSGSGTFETEEEKLRFFEDYAGLTARYVRDLYRPELLAPDRISVLPRAHRFGWYMGLALSARNCSDGGAYLANLRLALGAYPVMKHPISMLLERFEREERLRREKAEEFARLARQAKENIRALIAQGKLEEAGRFTVQLAALMPNDPEVIGFRRLTHTEPGMNELVSHLPQ